MSKNLNIDKNLLTDLYLNKKLTTIEIANKLKVGITTVNRYLRKCSIPLRNGKDCNRSRKWTGNCDLCGKLCNKTYRCKSCTDKLWINKNKEIIKEKKKIYRSGNLKAVNLAIKKCVEKNRDKSREYKRINKAKRRAIYKDGDLTIAQWRMILKEQNGICVYCSKIKKLTIDHIVPLSRGGKHTMSNVCGACMKCNITKNDRLLSEWKVT